MKKFKMSGFGNELTRAEMKTIDGGKIALPCSSCADTEHCCINVCQTNECGVRDA